MAYVAGVRLAEAASAGEGDGFADPQAVANASARIQAGKSVARLTGTSDTSSNHSGTGGVCEGSHRANGTHVAAPDGACRYGVLPC